MEACGSQGLGAAAWHAMAPGSSTGDRSYHRAQPLHPLPGQKHVSGGHDDQRPGDDQQAQQSDGMEPAQHRWLSCRLVPFAASVELANNQERRGADDGCGPYVNGMQERMRGASFRRPHRG